MTDPLILLTHVLVEDDEMARKVELPKGTRTVCAAAFRTSIAEIISYVLQDSSSIDSQAGSNGRKGGEASLWSLKVGLQPDLNTMHSWMTLAHIPVIRNNLSGYKCYRGIIQM